MESGTKDQGVEFFRSAANCFGAHEWTDRECIYRQVDVRARVAVYPCKVRWPRERVLVYGHTTAGGCVLLLNWTLLSVRERRSNRSGVLRDHPCTQRPRPSLSVNHCSSIISHGTSFRFDSLCFVSRPFVQPFSPRISSERSITSFISRERVFVLVCKIILYR